MIAGLPKSDRFGELLIVEVFDYYDGPKLFLCENVLGQLYLSMWVGEETGAEMYWIVALSRDRLLVIRSGGIGLDRAFLHPELGYVFVCRLPVGTGLMEVRASLPEFLDRELVPDADEFILLPTKTLPLRLADLGLSRKAVATQREILGLHFNFPGFREEAPTKQLGKILVSIQETVDALGQNVDGHPTMRGMIAPDILSRTETRLVQAAGGSFAVEISAAQAVDLFGRSLVTDALGELVELIEISDNAQPLREKLLSIKPRAAAKFKILLGSLLAADTPLHLDWASPDPARNKSVDLSLATAAAALLTAEQVNEEVGETVTGIGFFVGVELPRKAFTAVLREDETVYRGKIDDAAMPAAEHITLNASYRITIRETLEVTTSGEEKVKYALEAIEVLGS